MHICRLLRRVLAPLTTPEIGRRGLRWHFQGISAESVTEEFPFHGPTHSFSGNVGKTTFPVVVVSIWIIKLYPYISLTHSINQGKSCHGWPISKDLGQISGRVKLGPTQFTIWILETTSIHIPRGLQSVYHIHPFRASKILVVTRTVTLCFFLGP